MAEVLVAGHVCLDIIPELSRNVAFEPGRLIESGPATLSTGGAVSNTGISLSRLGTDVSLMGKVSDDIFGRAVMETLGPLNHQMILAENEPSSYTVVINLTGQDRMFLHAPGCNATFSSDDVPDDALANARILHFGYPPLMRRMYENDGEELVRLFSRAKEAGLTTSLDMSLPDLGSPSGEADWKAILQCVLPVTDVFMPSIEELMFMLDRQTWDQIAGAVMAHVPERVFERLANQSLILGAKVVGIKAGSRGLYVKGAHDLEGIGKGFDNVAEKDNLRHWQDCDLWVSCFKVDVAGTTGAGDATIAGMLHGILAGVPPMVAARTGVAAGAFCCERPDATSGVRHFDEILERINSGWERLPSNLSGQWNSNERGEYTKKR